MDRWRQDARSTPEPSGALGAHLAGVTQGSMEGLAQVLVQGGLFVSASEPSGGPEVARLRRLGIRVHTGHPPRSCIGRARWLVCDAETNLVDPLRLSARRRGLAVRTPAECLGALLRRGIGLALTGGRDASMAAAMIGWTLTRSGRDPTVVLASASAQLGGWARLGRGPTWSWTR